MRFANGALVVALAVGFLAPGARAQNSGDSSARAELLAPKSYRLVWTITDIDNGKTVGTQHYSMIVVTGSHTSVKMGSKIPVATGSYSGSNNAGVQTQFQYLDIGLNIYAALDQVSDGLKLSAKVEQSSAAVEDERTIAGVREPVVRQAVLEESAMLTLGKPVMLGSLDVPGSTRHLDVEVEMEEVR